jgi:hypothetical protein
MRAKFQPEKYTITPWGYTPRSLAPGISFDGEWVAKWALPLRAGAPTRRRHKKRGRIQHP